MNGNGASLSSSQRSILKYFSPRSRDFKPIAEMPAAPPIQRDSSPDEMFPESPSSLDDDDVQPIVTLLEIVWAKFSRYPAWPAIVW